MIREELIVIGRLAAGASDSEIAQTLLVSAMELTGARRGAVQSRTADGLSAPWTVQGISRSEIEQISRSLDAYGFGLSTQLVGEDHPAIQSMKKASRPKGVLRATSRTGDEAQTTIILLDSQDGGGFSAAHGDMVDALGAVASVALSNVRRRDSRRRYEQWMESIETTSTIMLGGIAARSVLESVLDSIARRALSVSQADMCAVATPDDTGTAMILRVALGKNRQVLTGLEFPEQYSLTGTVSRTSKLLLVEDAATDRRATAVAAEVSLGPTMIAPLTLTGRTVGVMFVGNTRGERPLDQKLAAEALTLRDLHDWIGAVSGHARPTDGQEFSGLLDRVHTQVRGWQELPKLSHREFELMTLLAEGLTNAEIGSRLFLAEKTVRNAVSALLNKLGLSNRVEAAVLLTRYSERHRRSTTKSSST